MEVGLYFGSFNPIHVGHLITASIAAQHNNLKQVWLVVSPHNPLKPSSTLLNEYHRLHLVNLAIENDLRLRASDIEFRLPKPSYTVHTMAFLKEKYPEHTFSIIMGSDSFTNITKWKNHEVLLRDHKFYIFQRRGFDIKETHGATIEILEAPILEISATQIRKFIKEGRSVRYLVTERVAKEIEDNRYYQ